MPTNGATAKSAAIAAIATSGPPRRVGMLAAGASPLIAQRSRPNSPAGRSTSTITMITKITVFDASG